MTLKNNWRTLLYQVKLCFIISKPTLHSNLSYSPEKFDSIIIRNFLSIVTLKFTGWPWQSIGHISNAVSSFLHLFKTVNSFKRELQSKNFQIDDFLSVWFWHLTNDHGKNNEAPLLCYVKLCASFCSYWWIQTGVTVRKRAILGQNCRFLAMWPRNLTDDLGKQ